MPALRRRRPRFDPACHAAELGEILAAVAVAPSLDARGLDRLVRRHPKRGRGLFSKSELIAGFRALGGETRFGVAEPELLARLRLRPVRTLSGVTPVTVLTKPFPCPGRCVFCPNDVRMPKSYLADEPGAQRAEDNRFDPYLQTWNRLAAYREIGHPTAKVELIVLGGTWSFHPETYQRWFVLRCLEALRDFGAGRDARASAGRAPARYRELAPVAEDAPGARHPRAYNRAVGARLAADAGRGLVHASERADWEALAAAQRANESAGSRCVGLSVETRPDAVDADECLRLRRLGVTKVQLGVQSLDDAVLRASRRGHDAEASRRAARLLRRFGMKLQVHWMPNLPGASPAGDRADFAALFAEGSIRPDELKLYPCVLIESAELADLHAQGRWQPYSEETLRALVADCLARTPEYCRVTRVIRDFSAGDIRAGSRTANLREVAEAHLRAEGRPCRDIRARELRGETCDEASLRERELAYAAGRGSERFLQLETPSGRLAAFLRLSLPRDPAPVAELEGCALVRELHVYGASLELGRRGAGRAQHAGLGRRLLARAAALARAEGYRELAVISAVGTRAYYRARGFRDGVLYQRLGAGSPAGGETSLP